MRHRLDPAYRLVPLRFVTLRFVTLRLVALGALAAVLWAVTAVTAVAAVAAGAGSTPLVPTARCSLAAPQPATVGGGIRSGAGQRACATPDDAWTVATAGADRDRDPLHAGPPTDDPGTVRPSSWDEAPVGDDRWVHAATTYGPADGRAPPPLGSR